MGLVTWAVMKTEVLPTVQELYFITAQDVAVLVDCANELLLRRVGDECLILDKINLANIRPHMPSAISTRSQTSCHPGRSLSQSRDMNAARMSAWRFKKNI